MLMKGCGLCRLSGFRVTVYGGIAILGCSKRLDKDQANYSKIFNFGFMNGICRLLNKWPYNGKSASSGPGSCCLSLFRRL